ncbi:dihydroflavonol-4-reductase [Nitrobacteraceae bacterium AZCC 2161]
MRIAVIGASGMLGRHTVEGVIAAGHDVVAVGRSAKSLQALAETAVKTRLGDMGDVTSLTRALKGVDAVINCAAYYPTVPRSLQSEINTATGEMRSFYQACATLPLSKIVYLGAAIALPKDPSGKPGTEELDYPERPTNPNPYLQVKWALDKQARDAAQQGLPVVIGIPTMSFGEFDQGRTTGRFILEMASRTLPGFVEGQRNIIYAGDAGRGLVRVCEDGRVGERYLLAGENLTMSELMGKISKATGAPMPKSIPLPAARLVSVLQSVRYKFLRGPEPKISSSAIAVMASGQFISGEKAARSLGFKPEVSVDEAIHRTLKWFQSQGMVANN